MERPELKQFSNLLAADFERHPVWIGCHTADYDKPWYHEVDEETFRPWMKAFPADSSDGMLLVRATLELRDGSHYPGFVTPAAEAGDLGTQQPQIFTDSQRFSFWGGLVGIGTHKREAFYAALNKSVEAIFPLTFSTNSGLVTGVTIGQVHGFYRTDQFGIHVEY